jgi:hypothetical protein
MKLQARPLKPLDEHPAVTRDHADKGYSLGALEALVDSCHNQPSDWRWRGDRAHAYYDIGRQLTPEREHEIRRDWKIEPRQTNLVHGVINGVLGQEAKARSDVTIEADDDDYQDAADVLSKAHKEAQRETLAAMRKFHPRFAEAAHAVKYSGWVTVRMPESPADPAACATGARQFAATLFDVF